MSDSLNTVCVGGGGGGGGGGRGGGGGGSLSMLNTYNASIKYVQFCSIKATMKTSVLKL